MRCPSCDSKDFEVFFETFQVPVHITVRSTYKEAMDTPKGNIRLAFCRRCANIFNTDFDEFHVVRRFKTFQFEELCEPGDVLRDSGLNLVIDVIRGEIRDLLAQDPQLPGIILLG